MFGSQSSTVSAAVGLGTVAVLDPHVVLDDCLVSRTAELDAKCLSLQRFATAMFLARTAILWTVIFHAQTTVVFQMNGRRWSPRVLTIFTLLQRMQTAICV